MPSPPTVPSRAGNATGPPPPSEQAPAAPAKGWHPVEWSCELVGTAVLVFLGLSAVVLDFGTHSPIASVVTSASARRLLTGVLFASSGALVTVSPLGRRSGAHLNPAVTLAFWLQGHVHRHDLAGYLVSQCAGAVGIEALMTGLLIVTIFAFVSAQRTARWTPLAVLVLVALEVWIGAPFTGTSLNPARSLGPAVVAGRLSELWIYWVGPLAAALLATVAWAWVPRVVLTAKLFHDPSYRSTLGSWLPVRSPVPAVAGAET